MRGLIRLTLVVAALGLIGCTGELVPLDPQPGPDPDPDPVGTPDAGGGTATSKAFFDDNVQPLFSVTRPLGPCITCHQNTDPIDGPDFLGTAPADNYMMLTSNQRLVSDDPATSLLVLKGLHTGDAFEATEISTIDQWIQLEAAQ